MTGFFYLIANQIKTYYGSIRAATFVGFCLITMCLSFLICWCYFGLTVSRLKWEGELEQATMAGQNDTSISIIQDKVDKNSKILKYLFIICCSIFGITSPFFVCGYIDTFSIASPKNANEYLGLVLKRCIA